MSSEEDKNECQDISKQCLKLLADLNDITEKANTLFTRVCEILDKAKGGLRN